MSPRKKTTIEEQWEKNQGFELTSVEQETYEKYFYGTEHWNYFTNDEDLGPVILSIKQETLNSRDQFRYLLSHYPVLPRKKFTLSFSASISVPKYVFKDPNFE